MEITSDSAKTVHMLEIVTSSFQLSPRLLISQHENEIGAHGIDHREAYWMTIYKNTHFHQNPTPYVLMAWGEWYDYK